MDEVKETLFVAKQLVSNVSSLLGRCKSVKCIIDSDGNFELTSNGLKYLRGIDCKHWVYDIIYGSCMCFDKKYGFGSENFLFFVGLWCDCFARLLNMDIPVNIITYAVLELLEHSIISLVERHSFEIINIKDTSHILEMDNSISVVSDDCVLESKVNTKLPSFSNSIKSNTSLFKPAHGSQLVNNTSLFKPPNTTISSNLLQYRTSPNQFKKTLLSSTGAQSINFSRYSRHAMIEQKETSEDMEFENNKKSIQKYCKVLCATDDKNIIQSITNLYVYEATYLLSKLKLKFFSDLYIDSDRIIIETVIGLNSEKVERYFKNIHVHKGVLVECNEWFLFDLLHAIDNSFINIALVNMVVYGDVLPDKKELDIKEVTNVFASNQNKTVLDSVKKMKDLNVSVIFYRGNLDKVNISEFVSNGIAVISVKDFSLIFKLSMMLSCDIVFGIDNVNHEDIRNVKVNIIHQVDHKKVYSSKVKYREKNNSLLYILIGGSPLTARENLYYSIVLMARTLDLSKLLLEKFWDDLQRVQSATKNKALIQTAGFPEEKIAECIPTTLNGMGNKIYHYPKWIKNDVDLYSDVVSKEIINVFRSCANIYRADIQKGVPHRFECCKYRMDVWRDSLNCVINVINTRKVNINL